MKLFPSIGLVRVPYLCEIDHGPSVSPVLTLGNKGPASRRATACQASNARTGHVSTRQADLSLCPAWSVLPRRIRSRRPPGTMATSST
jgi:hypothetical protein